MKTAITNILLLVLVIFLLTGCKSGLKLKKFVYEGTLFEMKGGPPMEGIVVTLYACIDGSAKDMCDFVALGKSTTDSLGHFEILAREARGDRYKVTLFDGKNENPITGP